MVYSTSLELILIVNSTSGEPSTSEYQNKAQSINISNRRLKETSSSKGYKKDKIQVSLYSLVIVNEFDTNCLFQRDSEKTSSTLNGSDTQNAIHPDDATILHPVLLPLHYSSHTVYPPTSGRIAFCMSEP